MYSNRTRLITRWLLVVGLPLIVSARVRTGLDVLVEQDFAPLAGKRVGIIANENSLTFDHRHLVELLTQSRRVQVTALFTPEHGLSVTKQAGAGVASSRDLRTGVPVYSLYQQGPTRPTAAMLAQVDALVFDLPDVGARFWTYTTTLGYVLESAAQSHIPVYVLDRPNPLNGLAVQGPILDDRYRSAIGYGRRPVRPGMTIGELAQFFNGEKQLGADLHVIKMQGWERWMWMDQTGLEWSTPSPNLRNLTEVILYPGTCLVENTRVSVGRGTDTPFQLLGAPWLQHQEMAEYLNAQQIPGVRFLARRFTPTQEPYPGQEVRGLEVELINRDELDSPRLGLELLAALLKFHPGEFSLDRKIMLLLGNEQAARFLQQGKTGGAVSLALQEELEAFRRVRTKYLLY